MLDHHHARFWQIQHLSTLQTAGENLLQVFLAVRALIQWVDHHFIGSPGEQQRLSWMPLLSACFLPALLAQTLGLSHKTVRGWWQVASAAVFRQLRLQGLHSLGEGCDLLLHLFDQRIPLHQLLTQPGDLLFLLPFSFFWAHADTLHIFSLSDKSVGDLSSYLFSEVAY